MSKRIKYNCMCCNKIFEGDASKNPLMISPVYDALIFRATGNYGSGIFDPMPIDTEEILQVIICDACIRDRIERVTRIYNIQRNVTVESGEFMP